MSLTSVSSVGNAAGSPGTPAVNVAQLEKQIQQLQKEIVTEQNSKDDAKTKSQLVTDYQLQITVLETQITQARQQAQLRQAQSPDDAATSGVERSRRKRSTDTSRYLDTSA